MMITYQFNFVSIQGLTPFVHELLSIRYFRAPNARFRRTSRWRQALLGVNLNILVLLWYQIEQFFVTFKVVMVNFAAVMLH